jgi:glutamate-1-semialdehyde 2,1-aminomutase
MFGASAELMGNVAPLGAVYQGGTLSGNPLATAAGLAALAALDEAAYERLDATAARLQRGLEAVADAAGLPVQVPRHRSLVGLFAGAEAPVTAWPGAKAAAETGLYARLFRALLDRGVALAPGPYEVLFPSLAHTDDVVDATLTRFAEACASLA